MTVPGTARVMRPPGQSAIVTYISPPLSGGGSCRTRSLSYAHVSVELARTCHHGSRCLLGVGSAEPQGSGKCPSGGCLGLFHAGHVHVESRPPSREAQKPFRGSEPLCARARPLFRELCVCGGFLICSSGWVSLFLRPKLLTEVEAGATVRPHAPDCVHHSLTISAL